MKTVLLSSTNSVTTAMEEEGEEISQARDSCYYPGCRKNTNCSCRMCLASISATLDLMPVSAQKSSLSKLSSSKPSVHRTPPLSFDASILSTPESNHRRIIKSPNLRSSGRSMLLNQKPDKPKKRDLGLLRNFLKLAVVLISALALDSGFSWAVSNLFQPKFSSAMVQKMGQNSGVINDFYGKLTSLQVELQRIARGKVSNCSYHSSLWEINQGGNLLHSKCILHKSAIEEVSIWGWPLQTAGLLTAGFSHRSFTVLSGRITEWSNGMVGYRVREANSSWAHEKWAASAVHLDSKTWILEYKRSSLFEDKSRRWKALVELLKHKISTMVKEELGIISVLESRSWYDELMKKQKKKKGGGIKIPT